MAETNGPVRTWLLAVHLIHTGRKGASALQLYKLLGVEYSTAWFLGHRIREQGHLIVGKNSPVFPSAAGIQTPILG